MIFVPLESPRLEISNGATIIANGYILRKLWTKRVNKIFKRNPKCSTNISNFAGPPTRANICKTMSFTNFWRSWICIFFPPCPNLGEFGLCFGLSVYRQLGCSGFAPSLREFPSPRSTSFWTRSIVRATASHSSARMDCALSETLRSCLNNSENRQFVLIRLKNSWVATKVEETLGRVGRVS